MVREACELNSEQTLIAHSLFFAPDYSPPVPENKRQLIEALRNVRYMMTSDITAETPQELIYKLSHETRRPLNALISGSSICLDEIVGPLNPEQRHYLNLIYQNSETMLQNITALMNALQMALCDENIMVAC